MRCMLPFGLVAFWTIAVLPAWAGPEIPAGAINERAKLRGERKVRYLLRQIDLTEEQATVAEGLIDSILSKTAHPIPPDIDEVRQIWSEIEKAREAGDQKRLDALTKRLQQMGGDATGDAEVFMNLESELSADQKQKLAQARARLERNPSGALRPVDLLRTARAFDLTAAQQRKLFDAFVATRKLLGPILRPSNELKLRMINFFGDEIRALLTPEQVARFEYRVCVLRPDLIDQGLRVLAGAESASDEPAADAEAKPTGD